MNWLHHLALASGLAFAAAVPLSAAHAQTAVVKRSTELRESPADNAPSLGQIPANTQVNRTSERNGPWVKVQTPQGATGWVHMFDLGPQSGSATPTNNAATSGLRGLGGLFGGNSGSTTTATSTVGIRGLDAEDIANAQPNPAAVGRAESLRVNADQARQFASSASLQSRDVPALAQPALPTSSRGSGSGSSNPSDPNYSPN